MSLTHPEREKLITEIMVMGRPGLTQFLRSLQTRFAMDFTDEYLESLSLERLRHLVLAAALHHDGSPARAQQVRRE